MAEGVENILGKCPGFPDITLIKGPNSAKLVIDTEYAKGEELFVSVFPGVTVSCVDLFVRRRPEEDGEDSGIFSLNFCIDGRCEFALDDGSYFYLQEKGMSAVRRTRRAGCCVPGGWYRGVSVYIDWDGLSAESYKIFEKFGLPLRDMEKSLLDGADARVFRLSDEQCDAFMWLRRLGGDGDLSDVRLALLTLLRRLKCGVRDESRIYRLGSAQAETARRAERMLMCDLSRRLTAAELAEDMGVSEASLKNCFRAVYGQSIPMYMRMQRMERAAELLVRTGETVQDIAHGVGYENQGKFAAVFREWYGISPLDYRRLNKRSGK